MPDDASRQGASRRATVAVLAGLFLGALALRTQLVGIGPLLASLALSPARVRRGVRPLEREAVPAS